MTGRCCNEETATFLDNEVVRRIVRDDARADSPKYFTVFATKLREFGG